MFANCMIILFLALEPLFRLWSTRHALRKLFLNQKIIWPWFDLVSVVIYVVLFVTYVAAFSNCKPTVAGTKNKLPVVRLSGKSYESSDVPDWCVRVRPVIAFGAFSILKSFQAIFLLIRIFAMDIFNVLQRKDEEALEGLDALISMTETVQKRLDDGTLVEDLALRKKLSDECRKVISEAQKKMSGVIKKGGGGEAMAMIKTRQVCREILTNAKEKLKRLEEDGDVDEIEGERLNHVIDNCKR